MRDLITTWLEDEESRFIYKKRIEFNEKKDIGAIREIIDKYVPEYANHYYYTGKENEIIEKVKGKTSIWIWGAGKRGKRIIDILQNKGIKIEGVIDRDCEIKRVMGVPVLHWDKVDFREINCLLISMLDRGVAEECAKKAILMGTNEKNIIMCWEYYKHSLVDKQYYEEFIKFAEGETFIDAGAFDLSTSLRFAEKCKENNISDFKIYAFEPYKIAYENCKKIKEHYPDLKMELMESGLWSSDTVIGFDNIGSESSRINEDSSDKIKSVALDSVVKERVTYIKMDIEGAELEALKGCQNIIKQYKPKLAICVYHKPEDIIEIPKYIKQLVPEYRLYLRHYSNKQTETVLYALP